MSTLVDQVRATGKALYMGQGGDDAYYLSSDKAVGFGYGPFGHGLFGHGSFSEVAESCRVQFEPWEDTDKDVSGASFDQVETMLTVTLGSETGDLTDVKKGGQFIIDNFWWQIRNIAMRTRTDNAWARVKIQRGRRISIGPPGSVMPVPDVSSGGRFDMRGK